MRKLLLWCVAGLVLASCAAASRSGPAAAPSLAEELASDYDEGSSNDIMSDSRFPRVRNKCARRTPWPWSGPFDWRTCMNDILAGYEDMDPCADSNILVWRHRDIKRLYLFENTTRLPTTVRYRDSFYANDVKFWAMCFRSSAYFETKGGWHGWQNWGFSGKLHHEVESNKVEFFEF